jgi:hypothetical protein
MESFRPAIQRSSDPASEGLKHRQADNNYLTFFWLLVTAPLLLSSHSYRCAFRFSSLSPSRLAVFQATEDALSIYQSIKSINYRTAVCPRLASPAKLLA